MEVDVFHLTVAICFMVQLTQRDDEEPHVAQPVRRLMREMVHKQP